MPLLKLTANAGGNAGGVLLQSPTVTTAYFPLSPYEWGAYDPQLNVAQRRDGTLLVRDPQNRLKS